MHPTTFRRHLEEQAARARWAFDVRDGASAKVNLVGVYRGRTLVGYNAFFVDTTRNARDPNAGRPFLLNDQPIPFLEEAEQFALAKLRGREVFYWRGTRAQVLGEHAVPEVRTRVTGVAPVDLRADAIPRDG